jgi:putative ABC transport system permease protein
MIRHLLKLAWHRKRANALLMLEIAVSFLVLFAVTGGTAWFAYVYSLPTGFVRDGVWAIQISQAGGDERASSPESKQALARLLAEARTIDGVQAAALAYGVPYDGRVWDWEEDRDGLRFSTEMDQVSDDLDKVLGIELVAGRWFEPADQARSWRPIVVNASAARAMFHADDVVGKTLPREANEPEKRIVGVVRDFRKAGELSAPGSFTFSRTDLEAADAMPPDSLLLKVVSGSGIVVEQAILDRLRSITPSWTFEMKTLDEMRATRFRERLVPLLVGAVIGVFLLMMVGMGLVGVLWQSVTTRTREFGVRRAAGASAAAVRRQIQLEIFVSTTISLLAASILVAQLPLLGFLPHDTARVGLGALAGSAGLMYLLTFLCGYYPSWMATVVQPAEALHSE